MADYRTIRSTAGARSEVIDSGLRAHMNKVYGTMSVGMLITALAAWAISGLATTTDPTYATAQMANGTLLTALGSALYLSPLRWIVMLAPLGILFFGFGHVMRKSSAAAAQLLFFVFASLIGISLSSIFIVYTSVSIVQTFLVTSIAFAGLSLWGYTTKKRHIGMGCIFNNGRDWNNHCVNNQHLLGLTSSNVCDFNYWFTCVCRSYRIRHAEYQNSISAACSPRGSTVVR